MVFPFRVFIYLWYGGAAVYDFDQARPRMPDRRVSPYAAERRVFQNTVIRNKLETSSRETASGGSLYIRVISLASFRYLNSVLCSHIYNFK